MKIVVAQLNNIVGDIQGNVDKAIKALSDEKTIKSDLVVFSELFISGYPPEDLVLKNSFLDACKIGLNSFDYFSLCLWRIIRAKCKNIFDKCNDKCKNMQKNVSTKWHISLIMAY